MKAGCARDAERAGEADPTVVIGEMSFFESEAGPKAPITITTSDLDVLVEEAFLSTLDYANQRSIPFVRIIDPGGLFPPSKRPAGTP